MSSSGQVSYPRLHPARATAFLSVGKSGVCEEGPVRFTASSRGLELDVEWKGLSHSWKGVNMAPMALAGIHKTCAMAAKAHQPCQHQSVTWQSKEPYDYYHYDKKIITIVLLLLLLLPSLKLLLLLLCLLLLLLSLLLSQSSQ